jgi:hypothetical protein
MKTKYLIIISIFLFVECGSTHRDYIKHDNLDFIFWSGRADELNSIENKFYFNDNGKYLSYNINIGTIDKIKLMNKLEEINYFEIADSINFQDKTSNSGKGLYIKNFNYEKTIYWDLKSLKGNKFKNKILELENTLWEIQKENLSDLNLPERGGKL